MTDKQKELELLLDQDESNLTALGKERLTYLEKEFKPLGCEGEKNIS